MVDVFKTSSISGWLSEHGADSGKLRIFLAGASQPASDGSLVTVSFRAASEDSIRKLDITELKLNDGLLNTYIENLPKVFAGLQNYPNPFNPDTWIPYELSEVADVAISIYNVNGQVVRLLELGSKMPGYYIDKSRAAYWDGRNETGEQVASGVYFFTIQAGDSVVTKKMILKK